MWQTNLELLDQLRTYDRSYQLFGAAHHRYRFNQPCTQEAITACEEKLGVELPVDLKTYYLEVGDGVVGPHYGIRRIGDLPIYYKPHLPYEGISYYLENSWLDDEEDGDMVDEDGYFEIEMGLLTGLVPIIEEGCGHQTCLVTAGPLRGTMVQVSNDGFLSERRLSLPELYRAWLEESLRRFQIVKALLDTDLTMDELDRKVMQTHKFYNGRDLAISLIGAQKPVTLFGDGKYSRIYGGAEQKEWYEVQLRRYRNGDPPEPEAAVAMPTDQLEEITPRSWSIWPFGWFKKR
ncbi:MAG: SMI1/KNR4 family protein [Chloroflexota bacterium]